MEQFNLRISRIFHHVKHSSPESFSSIADKWLTFCIVICKNLCMGSICGDARIFNMWLLSFFIRIFTSSVLEELLSMRVMHSRETFPRTKRRFFSDGKISLPKALGYYRTRNQQVLNKTSLPFGHSSIKKWKKRAMFYLTYDIDLTLSLQDLHQFLDPLSETFQTFIWICSIVKTHFTNWEPIFSKIGRKSH